VAYPTPLFLHNGVIHTFNEAQPSADTLAIDRATGRILAVGAERDVRAAVGIFAAIEAVDLHGQTVIPGLIDAHTHLLSTAQDATEVDLGGCADAQEAVARVAARAATQPKGTWVRGRHWNQQFWPGRAFPTRALLDAAVPDHPVALFAHSQHVMWVNSLALARAGIDAATPDPPGGVIGRDDDGQPTGILFEGGALELIDAVWLNESDIEEEEIAGLARTLRAMAARGLTGAHTMESGRSLQLMQRLHARGTLPLRVRYYLRVGQLAAARSVGLEGGFGDDWLRLAGIKIFADGALGTRTAAMLQPFADDPHNYGILTTPADQMEARVQSAVRGGLGVAIHAIGDRAVRVALDGIARAQAVSQTTRRFRLEHIQLADPQDIARMAQMGVVGSVQPFHAVSDRDVADRLWGDRAPRSYAYATLARQGVRLAFGSDVPIETADPWRITHAAIARSDDATPDRPGWHMDQSLTPMQSLWAYTVGAAWAAGDEAHLGQLAPGLLGDCLILPADPLHLATGELPRLAPIAVIVGGQVISGAMP
jgi:predicted amidohydrolase YtcJ